MIHGISNDFLYTAKKVIATWQKDEKNIVYSQGTGFFIQMPNSELVFVTNRHVVEPGYNGSQYNDYKLVGLNIESFKSFDENGQPININAAAVVKMQIGYDENQFNDIACLRNIHVAGTLEINVPVSYDSLATNEWINSKLSVCDTIAYPGFPAWHDHRNKTPIIRMGTIASDPRLDYCFQENDPIAARIAYEGFSSGGASGSPVFAIQKGFPVSGALVTPEGFFREVKLIGINAGHFSSDEGHSGISYFYKSHVIRSIIDRLCVDHSPTSDKASDNTGERCADSEPT